MGLQIPPTFCITSPSKKNPADNYGAPDPANFLHQLKESGISRDYVAAVPADSQKESAPKLCGGSYSFNLLFGIVVG
jgi:hypothetical protein